MYQFPKNFSKLDAAYIKEHPEFELKAERLLSRVEEIRKKMQLPQVNVIISSDGDTSARCFGTRHSWTPIVVSINEVSFTEQTYEEIEAQIAHELSHAFYSDELKDILFSTSFLIADMIGYYFSPLAVPAIEMASAPIHWYRHYQKEKAADLKGMEVLNTSQGFVALRKTQLARNIALSKVPGLNITPQGDSLYDIYHPPLTERLAYAKAFIPK